MSNKQHDQGNRHSLTGFVFNKLREEILDGKYKENDELKEVAIAKELDISRTPVREAIRQLELEGLVYSIPNKATYVIGISDKDIKDIYEIRALLERLCVKMAIENITDEELDKLESIIDLSEFYTSKGSMENVLELDNQYHELIYNAAGSKMLKHTLSDFHHYVQRIRHKTLADKDRAESATMEHKAIVRAIKDRNVDEAMDLAQAHIINAVKNIEKHGFWN